MVFEEIEVYDVCWIYLTEDGDQWWALVYLWKCAKFLSYLRSYSSARVTLAHELVTYSK